MFNYNYLALLTLIACGGLSVGVGTDYNLQEKESDEPEDTYIAESPVDTELPQDTDIQSPDYTGMIGGLIRFSSMEYGCPECFTDAYSQFSASGVLAFHEPTFQTWNDWIPAPGTCTSYLSQNDPADEFFDFGQKIELSVGSRFLPFFRNYENGTVRYDFSSTSRSDFQYNQPYKLNVYPNSITGAFNIPNVLTVPAAITLVSPTQLMNSMYSAFAPVVSQSSGMTIAWSPSGTGYFFVILDIYSSDGSTYLGGVLCVDDDDGTIFIQPAPLSSFYPGSLVAVYMHRYQLTETTHPVNGSTVQAISQVGLAGTATLNY